MLYEAAQGNLAASDETTITGLRGGFASLFKFQTSRADHIFSRVFPVHRAPVVSSGTFFLGFSFLLSSFFFSLSLSSLKSHVSLLFLFSYAWQTPRQRRATFLATQPACLRSRVASFCFVGRYAPPAAHSRLGFLSGWVCEPEKNGVSRAFSVLRGAKRPETAPNKRFFRPAGVTTSGAISGARRFRAGFCRSRATEFCGATELACPAPRVGRPNSVASPNSLACPAPVPSRCLETGLFQRNFCLPPNTKSFCLPPKHS